MVWIHRGGAIAAKTAVMERACTHSHLRTPLRLGSLSLCTACLQLWRAALEEPGDNFTVFKVCFITRRRTAAACNPVAVGSLRQQWPLAASDAHSPEWHR